MTSAGNPNVNTPQTTLYDSANHQVVAWEADETTVTTDNSVSPPVTYAKAKISGSFSSSPPSDLSGTGTISAAQSGINTPVAGATVALALGTGQSTWKAMLSNGGGGFTSGTTLVADKSPDGGTTWFSASFKVNGASPNTPQSSVTGPGPVELTGNAAGATHVRIRCSVLNSTETVAVRLDASQGVAEVGILAPLPAGTNEVGGVNISHVNGATPNIAQESGGNLASVATNTSNTATNTSNTATNTNNTSTAIGTQADAAYTSGSGSAVSILKGIFTRLANIVTLAFDNTNELKASLYGKNSAAGDTAIGVDSSGFVLTHQKLGGSDLSVSNPMPGLVVAQSGYVAAYGSNAANTTGGSDYSFKWGASGNTQVNHIMLQNNTGANINYDLDTSTSAGSPVLATGQTIFLDVQTSTLHLQSASNQNVNGTSASNIVVRGWL